MHPLPDTRTPSVTKSCRYLFFTALAAVVFPLPDIGGFVEWPGNEHLRGERQFKPRNKTPWGGVDFMGARAEAGWRTGAIGSGSEPKRPWSADDGLRNCRGEARELIRVGLRNGDFCTLSRWHRADRLPLLRMAMTVSWLLKRDKMPYAGFTFHRSLNPN